MRHLHLCFPFSFIHISPQEGRGPFVVRASAKVHFKPPTILLAKRSKKKKKSKRISSELAGGRWTPAVAVSWKFSTVFQAQCHKDQNKGAAACLDEASQAERKNISRKINSCVTGSDQNNNNNTPAESLKISFAKRRPLISEHAAFLRTEGTLLEVHTLVLSDWGDFYATAIQITEVKGTGRHLKSL